MADFTTLANVLNAEVRRLQGLTELAAAMEAAGGMANLTNELRVAAAQARADLDVVNAEMWGAKETKAAAERDAVKVAEGAAAEAARVIAAAQEQATALLDEATAKRDAELTLLEGDRERARQAVANAQAHLNELNATINARSELLQTLEAQLAELRARIGA